MKAYASSVAMVLVAAALTSACSGKVDIGSGNEPGDSGSATPDSGTPSGDGGTVATDSGPPLGDAGGDTGLVSQQCSTPAGPRHTFTSVQDVESSITGRWLLCSGRIGSPSDSVGIEFAGSVAYFLVRDANGTVVRGAGFDYERDVSVIDTTAVNGPGSYQINLSTGSGTNMYLSDYSESPRRLRLNEATSGNVGDYAAE
jgi:hypothetical protein